jgi:hypothetical protein
LRRVSRKDDVDGVKNYETGYRGSAF